MSAREERWRESSGFITLKAITRLSIFQISSIHGINRMLDFSLFFFFYTQNINRLLSPTVINYKGAKCHSNCLLHAQQGGTL